MGETINVLSFNANFSFQINSAKMHSMKSFSRFFCDASVPIPNGHSIYRPGIVLAC